ncbi:MAG: hypothetical protein ACTSP5_11505 [Candidatus Heimdallarchaeota archaeon]
MQFPKDFPEAKSVIVLAVECNLAKIPFHYKGKKYDVLLPGNYSATSKTPKEEIDDFVLEKIIGQSDYRVQQTRQLVLSNCMQYSQIMNLMKIIT